MKPSEPSPLYGLLLPSRTRTRTEPGAVQTSANVQCGKSAALGRHLLCNTRNDSKHNTLRTQCLFPHHTRVITQCFYFSCVTFDSILLVAERQSLRNLVVYHNGGNTCALSAPTHPDRRVLARSLVGLFKFASSAVASEPCDQTASEENKRPWFCNKSQIIQDFNIKGRCDENKTRLKAASLWVPVRK